MASDSFRLVRLVGDGDNASGGGLPLPDAFTAVVQELLDNGPQESERLVRVVEDALSYKEKRVLLTWRTWDDFTRDVLAQLQDAEIITQALDRWYLGLRFEHGKRHVIIPERDIGITVHARAERRKRDAMARARLDIRRIITQLESEGVTEPRILDRMYAIARVLNPDDHEVPAETEETDTGKSFGPRPTSTELARRRYGLDGGRVNKAKNVFGPDGKRRCTMCGEMKDPDNFAVYLDDHGWFLRSYCNLCDSARRNKRARRPGH